ncbi:hypothetical protein GCWU000321_01884 [Dialister invisus DSM 15470]|uniref:Uncharacterized protein n=1 Tax=Dialister invisus DSM 15470 TaxID=592028 RepID=C9LQQ2_9FIRM|nr:hypothetical protein GCWU000321_01884 [Dialister invisus DSM 15470]
MFRTRCRALIIFITLAKTTPLYVARSCTVITVLSLGRRAFAHYGYRRS